MGMNFRKKLSPKTMNMRPKRPAAMLVINFIFIVLFVCWLKVYARSKSRASVGAVALKDRGPWDSVENASPASNFAVPISRLPEMICSQRPRVGRRSCRTLSPGSNLMR